MAGTRALIAGNWKMNGLRAASTEMEAICRGAARAAGHVDLLVCPPATLLAGFAQHAAGSRVALGGQDCHAEAAGAHTGDLSAEMLADGGATAVIVGHSERRNDHGETDAVVRAKALAARRAGLTAVICVGETKSQRLAGETLAVVGGQLQGSVPDGATDFVVAYEPVWAIGTGLTPSVADVAEVHAFIRAALVKRFGETGKTVRILYGGSVKPSNAAELLAVADVNGALVGGASLKAEEFLSIAAAAPVA
jgi:triosephosphate isomerase